jgi:hypothetical protein
MSVLASSLIAGIVSGIMASLIIFVFRIYWLRILQPWYENRLYQGAIIEGDWTTTINFPDGTTNTHRISLRRVGYAVNGVVNCVSGYSEGQTYELAGTFKNLLLTGNYQVINSRSLERGTFTLMLIEGGARLRGYVAYYDNLAHSVMAAPCEWVIAGDVIPGTHNPAHNRTAGAVC